jgi:hypothetical protein
VDGYLLNLRIKSSNVTEYTDDDPSIKGMYLIFSSLYCVFFTERYMLKIYWYKIILPFSCHFQLYAPRNAALRRLNGQRNRDMIRANLRLPNRRRAR